MRVCGSDVLRLCVVVRNGISYEKASFMNWNAGAQFDVNILVVNVPIAVHTQLLYARTGVLRI